MGGLNVKTEFSRLISLIKEFNWKEQPWMVKTGIMFGGCTAFLILRRIIMGIEGKINKRPPQLYGLPIVGSVFTMIIWNHEFGRRLLPKYGDIVMYNQGPFRMYAINDMQLLNCVFSKATDRRAVDGTVFSHFGYEVPLVAVNNDRDWAIRRKTAMASMAKVISKKELEEQISVVLQEITFQELNSLLNNSNDNNNNHAVWYPRNFVRNAVFNVLYFALFGKSSVLNDEIYQSYNQSVATVTDCLLQAFMATQMSGMVAAMFGATKGKEKFVGALDTLYCLTEKAFKEIIDDKKSNDNDNDKNKGDVKTIAECMYDTYATETNNGIMDKKTYDRCVADLVVLILAGLDTSSHTTEVGILLLAKYPQIQALVYKELCRVFKTGDNHEFTFEKIHKSVVFRAFVNETLRIACAAPNGITRASEKELRCIKWQNKDSKTFQVICEYSNNKQFDFNKIIKNKNHQIIYDYIIEPSVGIEGNLAYLLLKNENIWNEENDPMKIHLNYWLKRNEQNNKLTFKNNLNSTPFGVGKNRDCLGQTLARKELLALLANLILNYKIEAQNGDAASVNIQYKLNSTYIVDPQIPVRISKR